MKKFKNVHVIVAPSPLKADELKYRRNRLLDFLLNQEQTSYVVWFTIEPEKNMPFSLKKPQVKRKKRVIEIKISDIKNIISLNAFLQKKYKKYLRMYLNNGYNLYLWYTSPFFSELANMKIWKAVVYDCSDYWGRENHIHRIKKRMTRNSEKRIIQSADYCFASSKQLFHHLSKYRKNNIFLVENGVDYDVFQKSKFVKSVQKDIPVFGFVGGLKPWKIDFKLLLEVAKAKPKWHIVIIGSTYGEMPLEYDKLIKLPNVERRDAVPFSEIPGMMKKFDVALLPYLENDYNKGVFPLKFFEYLASGLPVVGCGLPSTLEYVKPNIYEHVEGRADLFIESCERALISKEQYRKERIEMAKKADWNAKFEQMWEIVRSSK